MLAAEAGLAGVVLSNHGGRQLGEFVSLPFAHSRPIRLCADFARSGIEILVEVMDALRQRDLLKNGFEV